MTESDALDAVAQTREVGSSAALLHDQEALAGFTDPRLKTAGLSPLAVRMSMGAGIIRYRAAATAVS